MGGLITVVIPTYNRANLIKDAIKTVFSQTYQKFEIIIVDDGSEDNTSEVIKNLTDERIKYIYQKNSGVSSARNNGIKNAKGEYIAFLDSDDLWHPQKLEKQLSVLENNPNIGLVTSSSKYITFEKKFIKIKKHCAEGNILLNPDRVFCGTPTLLIRKNIFEKSGLFDETMNFCEDWDLFFRISLICGVYSIPEVLTYVRSHKESLSKSSPVGQFREGYLKFLDKSFNNENLPVEMLKVKNRAYSNALWNIGFWALYKSNDYKIARASLFESLRKSYLKIFNVKFLIALFLSCSPQIFLNGYGQLKKCLGRS